MKNIILFGSAIMVFLILTGSSAADDQIDTSNIFIMGYYNPGLEIDLSQTSTENDINLPGFSLFAALSILLIIVHMKQKKN